MLMNVISLAAIGITTVCAVKSTAAVTASASSGALVAKAVVASGLVSVAGLAYMSRDSWMKPIKKIRERKSLKAARKKTNHRGQRVEAYVMN